MPWPMSRPSGEGRSQGEGAANSHWASIILLVAAPSCADPQGRRMAFPPIASALTSPPGRAFFLQAPVTGLAHAEMQSDAARALQCRAPPAQPRRLRGMEPGDVRGVQQPELPRA